MTHFYVATNQLRNAVPPSDCDQELTLSAVRWLRWCHKIQPARLRAAATAAPRSPISLARGWDEQLPAHSLDRGELQFKRERTGDKHRIRHHQADWTAKPSILNTLLAKKNKKQKKHSTITPPNRWPPCGRQTNRLHSGCVRHQNRDSIHVTCIIQWLTTIWFACRASFFLLNLEAKNKCACQGASRAQLEGKKKELVSGSVRARACVTLISPWDRVSGWAADTNLPDTKRLCTDPVIKLPRVGRRRKKKKKGEKETSKRWLTGATVAPLWQTRARGWPPGQESSHDQRKAFFKWRTLNHTSYNAYLNNTWYIVRKIKYLYACKLTQISFHLISLFFFLWLESCSKRPRPLPFYETTLNQQHSKIRPMHCAHFSLFTVQTITSANHCK